MQALSEKEWDERTIEELFLVGAGKRLTNADKIDGNKPFIGATDNNNGVTGFVGNENPSRDKNVLGVNYNGAPCIAFYHPYECVFTDDVKRLHLRHHADGESVLLFFKTIVMQQRSKYSYGYKFKEKRMLRQKLMLPVTAAGEPDYDYMENYILHTGGGMLMRYKNYIAEQLSQLEYKEIPALNEKEWKDIEIGTIADVNSGRDIYAQERTEGNTPYITSGTSNNGIGYFVGNDNDSKARNAISVNRNGAVGEAFYHPYNALYGNDCRRVNIRAVQDAYTQLFIAKCISMQKEAFSYSRKLGTARLKRLHIMLPVTDSGEPDYDYMAQYTKNMMLRKYEQYLAFIGSKQREK